MGTQKIWWLPTTSPNVVAYEILYSDTGIEGPYLQLGHVLSDIAGRNWDATKNAHFYEDAEVPYRYYRLRVLDRYGHVADDAAPLPFKAGNKPVQAPTLHFVALGADYQTPARFKYVSPGGVPIEGAAVRIYRKVDYLTSRLDKVVGTARTDAFGKWGPVFVEPGDTYTLVFSKPDAWGPDTQEVVV